MRKYELMVILDPNLDERTVAPSLETRELYTAALGRP